MEENDDWKLGDEGEATVCPHCGRRNRPGLSYCVICGSVLAEGVETDPGSLRTLGEAMGGMRRARRAPPRHSLRAWVLAAGLLLTVVVVLTWLQTREEPLLLEDLLVTVRSTATPPPATTALPTAVATRIVVPTRVAPLPTPVAVAAPPVVVPTVTAAPPPPRPAATARPVAPAARPPRPAARRVAPAPRPEATPEPIDEPTPGFPRVAATEKASLGTDLQDATREYRRAVDVHNARVDEYNALADEIQRRNAWDDSEASVELRRRLDRARQAVESAQVEAEMLRARMESVRARYR